MHREAPTRSEQMDAAARWLIRVLGKQSRQPCAVVSCGDALSEALSRDRPNIESFPGVEQLPRTDQQFRSVILLETLEHVPEAERDGYLNEVWARVEVKGRLVVVAKHAEAVHSSSRSEALKRKELKRLLRPRGKVKSITEQPYRWLIMYVTKSGQGRPDLSAALEYRYEVMANLCRGRVVDLGCGRGQMTRMLHERGLDVVGVDMSEKKIAEARRLSPGTTFIESDILAVSLPEGGFDTAVLAEVLEHVPEEVGMRMLDKAWKLVAPGGRLVVSVPNENCIPHPNHLQMFSRKSLVEMLSAYGRPRLVTDQPFKWIMMHIDKKG